jgi:hypothetical protein
MSDQTITPDTVTDADPTVNDRRALLRKLAIGGAGAAAGAVLLNHGTASAGTEGGGPGNNFLELGQAPTNTSVTPTTLVHDPAAPRTAGASSLSVAGAVPGATAPYPAQVGGYGNAEVANGIHGSTTAPGGFGVVAANLAPASAAGVQAPTAQAIAAGNGVHMLLLAGAKTGPADGKHVAGEVYVDKDGTLWFTVPAATAGEVSFVKLAATSTAGTAGSYHAINPQRAYDSRQPNYTVKGVLAPKASRVISIADGHSANGTVTLANAVPAGATAVQINVTAGDVASTDTSLLNWDAGVKQIANSITVPVDADRKIKVTNGDQTGSTEVIIDFFGYYI